MILLQLLQFTSETGRNAEYISREQTSRPALLHMPECDRLLQQLPSLEN